MVRMIDFELRLCRTMCKIDDNMTNAYLDLRLISDTATDPLTVSIHVSIHDICNTNDQ